MFELVISLVAVVLASPALDAGCDARGLAVGNCVCVIGTDAVSPVSRGAFTPLSFCERPLLLTSPFPDAVVVSSSLMRLLAG